MNDLVFVDKPAFAPVMLFFLPGIALAMSVYFIVLAYKRLKAGKLFPVTGVASSAFLAVLLVAVLSLVQAISADISSALACPSEAMAEITMMNILFRLRVFVWTPAVLLFGVIGLGVCNSFWTRHFHITPEP